MSNSKLCPHGMALESGCMYCERVTLTFSSDERCRRIKPLRCWQYRKGDERPVPRWIASHLMNLDTSDAKFYGSRSEEWSLDEGDWVVEFIDGEEGEYGVYSDEEFRKQYELCS